MESSDIENDKNFYVEKLGLNVVSEVPKAYFLSVDGYHHHFGMNQWNGMRKIPKKDKILPELKKFIQQWIRKNLKIFFQKKNGNKSSY